MSGITTLYSLSMCNYLYRSKKESKNKKKAKIKKGVAWGNVPLFLEVVIPHKESEEKLSRVEMLGFCSEIWYLGCSWRLSSGERTLWENIPPNLVISLHSDQGTSRWIRHPMLSLKTWWLASSISQPCSLPKYRTTIHSAFPFFSLLYNEAPRKLCFWFEFYYY